MASAACVLAAIGGIGASAEAQVAGREVHQRQPVEDDLYTAGEKVRIDARVEGDVLAAGQSVRVDGDVREDVMAAGREVTIVGDVGDDLRATGAEVVVSRAVGDDAMIAGRVVRLGPESSVGGDTRIAGREVAIDGELRGPLAVEAEDVRLSGHVASDVEVKAKRVELLPGARIDGELRYEGPGEPRIAEGTTVAGGVTIARAEGPGAGGERAMRFAFYLLSVGLAGVLLLLVFPRFTLAAARNAAASPWKSLGVGLISLVATPIVAFALMLLVFGVWIGLPLLGLYIALLPVALLVGIVIVSTFEARLFGWDLGRKGLLLAAFAIALLLLGLVGMIPVAGGIVFTLVVILGLGAVLREAFARMRSRTAA